MPLDLLPIPLLPTPPSKTDPANFAERADIFLEALPDFCTDTNSTIATLNLITSGLDQATPIAAYNAGTTYNFPDVCAGTDGYTYRCISTGVIGDDPVGSVTLNWVKVGGGGGLAWSVETTDKTTIPGRGYMMDNSSSAHTVTLHTSPKLGDSIAVGDLNGNFAINNCTIDRNSMLIHGVAEDMILDVKNQRCTLTYTGVTDGWVVTELEPNNSQFEYMPYAVMHVREEQPSGTNGGSSIAGTQTRVLNQTKKNDISGASLNSNQITLPTGEYEFKCIVPFGEYVGLTKLRVYNVTTSTYIAEGQPGWSATGSGSINASLSINGFFTLASPSVIELRHYTQAVQATYGLGKAISQGTEVYSEAIITKIGNNYAPRLITTDARLQMISGLDYTGNVLGFDVTRKDNTTVTISKGTCKDSTGLVDLYLTANTDVTLQTGANTLSHLFVCRLLNGTMTAKSYASEAAAAADTGVINAFRWVGYWANTGGGSIAKAGTIKDGQLWWERFSENAINSATTPPANITTAIDLSTFLPVSRVSEVLFGAKASSTVQRIAIGSVSGTAQFTVYHSSSYATSADVSEWDDFASARFIPIISNNIYWGRGSYAAADTMQLAIHAIKLRR